LSIFVCDHGTKNGVTMYRINGTENECEQYIEHLKGQDIEFVADPILERVRSGRNEWTSLFEFRKLEIHASLKENEKNL
jgi:hypothetical protein